MKEIFTQLIDTVVTVLYILTLARAIISWMPNAHGQISDFIVKATDPMLNPIRRLIPAAGGIDFSPLILFFLLQILRDILYKIFQI